MKTLSVKLTNDQYNRFQAALTKMQNMDQAVSDDQLIAQLKREASAITYAVEIGSGDGTSWVF